MLFLVSNTTRPPVSSRYLTSAAIVPVGRFVSVRVLLFVFNVVVSTPTHSPDLVITHNELS